MSRFKYSAYAKPQALALSEAERIARGASLKYLIGRQYQGELVVEKIGEILIRKKIISQEQLETALALQKKEGGYICASLIKLGSASEEQIFNALSKQLNIPFIPLKNRTIDPILISKVPAKFASHYKIIPLEINDETLTLAMVNPENISVIDDITLLLNTKIKAVLASEPEIDKAIRKYYGVGAETLEKMISQENGKQPQRETEKIEDLTDLSEDASIIKFVNQILSEAIKERATDIHLEPFEDELRTRFRVDGILYNINIPQSIRNFHPAILSRIKIMANLNIAERRLPQDGRIKIKIEGKELDLRVSIMPTIFGEAAQIRLLSPSFLLELEKLGFLSEDLQTIENAIHNPHGVIFVTGPTGSGKSTTLYAALSRINFEGIKIITIEDPVEYQLKGINQIQTAPRIGLDFAAGLRHILRHDPDVIMVGEVRDYETAEIAIRSALTGHLVLSTLHTNDAAGTVTRLLDMKIEPFLVSSSLTCIIAQRLIRLICPKCKEPMKSSEEIMAKIKDIKINDKNAVFYEGKGCPECRFTGFRNRTAIYEILNINGPIREMILNHASSHQIKEKAISSGMRTLRQDGLQKALAGLTTYGEVMRVTQQEETLG